MTTMTRITTTTAMITVIELEGAVVGSVMREEGRGRENNVIMIICHFTWFTRFVRGETV